MQAIGVLNNLASRCNETSTRLKRWRIKCIVDLTREVFSCSNSDKIESEDKEENQTLIDKDEGIEVIPKQT